MTSVINRSVGFFICSGDEKVCPMMEYKSILFPTEEKREAIDYQEVLKDINADQIISSVTSGYEEYRLDDAELVIVAYGGVSRAAKSLLSTEIKFFFISE